VDAQLASLAESFGAVFYLALEGADFGMSEVVLGEVLLQSESLAAGLALEVLFDFVDKHVSLEAVLGLEEPIAGP